MNAMKMKAHSTTVTVVMPVFNAAKYVSEAIDSILIQTLQDFEFVVVDDQSTDSSLDIVRDYAKKDSRVRVLLNPNKGLAHARNAGSFAAQGEFIAVMDADDVALPLRLERQVAFLTANPHCVAVGAQTMLITESGDSIRECVRPTGHDEIEGVFLEGRAGVTAPTAMIRAQAFREVMGYRQCFEYAEDLDLFLRLARVGQLANIQDVLLKYRVHVKSVSRKHSRVQKQRAIAALEEAYAERRLELPEQLRRNLAEVRSLAEWHGRFARQAIRQGNSVEARRHALMAVRLAPHRRFSWRVLFASLFKVPRQPHMPRIDG